MNVSQTTTSRAAVAAVAGDGLPPGPKLPRSIQSLCWAVAGPRFLDRCYARYGTIFTLDINPYVMAGPAAGHEPNKRVFLTDPESIRRVLTVSPPELGVATTNRFLEHLVGPTSILVLDEPEHLEQRKLLLPPFHGERVRRYEQVMRDVALAAVGDWPTNRSFPLLPRMQEITLDVIVQAVFGIRQPNEIARFRALLRRMLDAATGARYLASQTLAVLRSGKHGADLASSRPTRRLLAPVDAALHGEIARRRASGDFAERDDILSMLMQARREDGSPLSDGQLRDELITLLIAGHESTAIMLAWAFERVLRHPDMLDRLRAEARTGDTAYGDAVVKETLRLRPVLPILLRELTTPLSLGGYELPAGTWVAPCTYLVQRNPDVYPDPLAFRPERFLDSRTPTYAWTPFGGGVRRCAGAAFAQLEMRVVLQTVLTHCELRPSRAAGERVHRRFITHAPSRGGRVRVVRKLSSARGSAANGAVCD
jgi:cytochrome P450